MELKGGPCRDHVDPVSVSVNAHITMTGASSSISRMWRRRSCAGTSISPSQLAGLRHSHSRSPLNLGKRQNRLGVQPRLIPRRVTVLRGLDDSRRRRKVAPQYETRGMSDHLAGWRVACWRASAMKSAGSSIRSASWAQWCGKVWSSCPACACIGTVQIVLTERKPRSVDDERAESCTASAPVEPLARKGCDR